MLEFTETQDDRIGIRLGGEVTAEDAARMVEAMTYRLATRERIDLHVELETPEFTTEALEAGLRHLPLFERLRRVAVVADPGWSDTLGEVEALLLRDVDVRLFPPSERAEARAWLETSARSEGSGPASAGTATEIPTNDDQVLAFEIRGRATLGVLSPLIEAIRGALGRGNRVRVLLRLGPFVGFDSGLLLDEPVEGSSLDVFREVERYAIVDGPPRIARLLHLLRSVLRVEARHFERRDEDEAWAWLGARPEGKS